MKTRLFHIVLFVCSITVFNSCSNDDKRLENSAAFNSFKNAIDESNRNLTSVKVESRKKQEVGKKNENLVPISLTKVDSNSDYLIEEFSDVALLVNQGELILNEDPNLCDVNTICLDVDEVQIQESLTPTVSASKQLLYDYNFTEAEIQAELGLDSEVGVMYAAMVILEIEKKLQNPASNTFASKGDAWSCIGAGLGITGIYDLIQNTRSLAAFGEAATRKQLLRLVAKLGRRFLGWIGVAVFIHDFGNCMEYW